MLVVTANWQIGDGSILPPPGRAAVARFVADLRRSAVREGWRPDGRYEPVRSVDLVFAGDTFDRLLSREWLGCHRPWERGGAPRAAAARVLAGCLGAARRVFGELGCLARHGLDVPAADAHGRPAAARTTTVPLRVTLLEGNLDAGLGRDGAEAIGALPDFVIGTCWEGEHVRVEHGHDTDPAWWSEGAGRCSGPSLGQSLRVDLLGRFATAPLPDPARTVRDRLVERMAARDVVAWPALLSGATAAAPTEPGAPSVTDLLAASWRDAVSAWRRAARRSGVLLDAPFDLLDGLAAMLVGDGDGGDLAPLLGPTSPSAAAPAGATVVLGHPPAACSRPWDRPRLLCLGGESAAEAATPGVLEIAPVVGREAPATLVVHGCRPEGETPTRGDRPGGRMRMIGSRHRVIDAA